MIVIINGKAYNARHTPFCIISNYYVDSHHLQKIKKKGDGIHLTPPEWSEDREKIDAFIADNERIYHEYIASGEQCKLCEMFNNCDDCPEHQRDLGNETKETFKVDFKINNSEVDD